jgi:hypothetical protein
MDVDYQNTFAETLGFTLYQMLFAKSWQLATGLAVTIIAIGSFTWFSTLPVALVEKIVAVVAVILARGNYR